MTSEPQQSSGSGVPLRAGSLEPLAVGYDVALLDLDGVVYVGPQAVPSAPGALASARELGLRLAFVTNNASRTPDSVAGHLTELGVPAAAEDVITSAQAAATLLRERLSAGAPVLVIGGEGLIAAVGAVGLAPVRTAAEKPAALVQGFDPEVGWRQLAEGAFALASGIPWIVSNTDLTIPVAQGIAPGNGSLVQVLRTTTGREPDAVAGKPYQPLARESLLRTGARRGLAVGDRLDTDIEGASRAGVDSLLVFTGVSTWRDAVRAPVECRPTYLSADLDGLLRPHPPVLLDVAGARCGGWQWTSAAGAPTLTGAGDPLDALRAGCVLVWDDPTLTDHVIDLLGELQLP